MPSSNDALLRIACITFTPAGTARAERLKAAFERRGPLWLQRPLSIFHSNSLPPARVTIVPNDGAHAQLEALFHENDGIVFLCDTGRAVRLAAPFFQEAGLEPAIVAVDECGRYAVSLTSGSLRDGLELADMVSRILGSQAVMTTAPDGCGIEAIDLFARKYGLLIENLRHAAHITTLMVEGAPLQLVSELPIRINYPNLVDEQPDACIYVTSQADVDCGRPHCVLRPRTLHVGLTCRGASKDAILHAVMRVFAAQNLSLNSIRSLSAPGSARAEAGLPAAAEALQCDLRFWEREALKRRRMTVGDPLAGSAGQSLCERCAALAGGPIIVGKTLVDGIGVAVARQASLSTPAAFHI